ncbi:MAG: hypothetical protein DRJ52_10655 [Thermoprotei archaeon]|nr:MAG: hypothetical protein DRJ52_10655 [Thermoprotei archaeon]
MLKKKEESRVKRLLKACHILLEKPLELDEVVAAEAGLKLEYVKALRDALSDLRMLFPNKPKSWFIRAAVRSFYVKKVSKNHWTVQGIRILGDHYTEYHVTFNGEKYSCSCYVHLYGYTRRKRICTHIAAVMVNERILRKLGFKKFKKT